ncbi:hypothetical protein [Marinomonas mediterranea]|jgi:hypothetical protein|uniref:Uncharacterized protein n=1 Tax=Marinomonas mediterranea (strain ATCC 700492 / JCM 21426 / NBRC 103028 / MMB-1) TaxID=717774 RepID=F2K2Q6_MARM1|nr:hypothetical protein [Marinomonas mediterranea]ADZ91189.1 hypothetical protein Marme_1940 [Marinomonas mediterranea MMB-1]WCN17316.1 hypothetical protein GV053_09770 [Marinomonas mediterranea MMB-1]
MTDYEKIANAMIEMRKQGVKAEIYREWIKSSDGIEGIIRKLDYEIDRLQALYPKSNLRTLLEGVEQEANGQVVKAITTELTELACITEMTSAMEKLSKSIVMLAQSIAVQQLEGVGCPFKDSNLVASGKLLLSAVVEIAISMVAVPIGSIAGGLITQALGTTGPSEFGLVPTRTVKNDDTVKLDWNVQWGTGGNFGSNLSQAARESVTNWCTGLISSAISGTVNEAKKQVVKCGAKTTDMPDVAVSGSTIGNIPEVDISQVFPDAISFDDKKIENLIIRICFLNQLSSRNKNWWELSATEGATLVETELMNSGMVIYKEKRAKLSHDMVVRTRNLIEWQMSQANDGSAAAAVAYKTIIAWHQWQHEHNVSTKKVYRDTTWDKLSKITVNGKSLIQRKDWDHIKTEVIQNPAYIDESEVNDLLKSKTFLSNINNYAKVLEVPYVENERGRTKLCESIIQIYRKVEYKRRTSEWKSGLLMRCSGMRANNEDNCVGTLLTSVILDIKFEEEVIKKSEEDLQIQTSTIQEIAKLVAHRLTPEHKDISRNALWHVELMNPKPKEEENNVTFNNPLVARHQVNSKLSN